MICDLVADLHGNFPQLEGGDLLIVAGDLTSNDQPPAWAKFFEWLAPLTIQYTKILIVAGNHDNALEYGLNPSNLYKNVEHLCDSGTEFEGLKIWGSPWTKTFPGMNPKCKAFTCDSEDELMHKFALIPNDTDILVTHSPPFGYLDENIEKTHCGSKSLLECLNRIKPKLVICGHIHENGGKKGRIWHPLGEAKEGKTFWPTDIYNASHVNERYQPVNKPIRVNL